MGERSGSNSEKNSADGLNQSGIKTTKKYSQISNSARKELINRYLNGEKLIVVTTQTCLCPYLLSIQVSKELKMNYSSAKSILKVYRQEKREHKIPVSQRHLYPKWVQMEQQSEKKSEAACALEQNLRERKKQIHRKNSQSSSYKKGDHSDTKSVLSDNNNRYGNFPEEADKVQKKICRIRFLKEVPVPCKIEQEPFTCAKEQSPLMSIENQQAQGTELKMKQEIDHSGQNAIKNSMLPIPSLYNRPEMPLYHTSLPTSVIFRNILNNRLQQTLLQASLSNLNRGRYFPFA